MLPASWRAAPWLTGCTAVALLILLALGTWQLQRLQWKQTLIADMEAGLAEEPAALPASTDSLEGFDFRRIAASGQFLHDKALHLGPRQRDRRPGVHLLTPLRLDDGRLLLVNRGWLPTGVSDDRIARPQETVALSGILRTRFPRNAFTPDYDASARLWFWYDLDGMSRVTGLNLLPAVLEADAGGEGLPAGGTTRVEIVNNHLQYALTWYGLAAALISVFIVYQRQRGRK